MYGVPESPLLEFGCNGAEQAKQMLNELNMLSMLDFIQLSSAQLRKAEPILYIRVL